MATCAHCGKTILFGGKKLEDRRFCSKACLSHGHVAVLAEQIPDDVVAAQAREIHAGACPVCNEQRGPVDVHTSHKIISFILMSSWSSNPRVSCGSCAKKAQFGGLLYSFFLGWWGIPWGIIMTPVQVVKNLAALFRSEESLTPSEQLQQLVRMNIANQVIESQPQAPQ